jgi:hypothetical protein
VLSRGLSCPSTDTGAAHGSRDAAYYHAAYSAPCEAQDASYEAPYGREGVYGVLY